MTIPDTAAENDDKHSTPPEPNYEELLQEAETKLEEKTVNVTTTKTLADIADLEVELHAADAIRYASCVAADKEIDKQQADVTAAQKQYDEASIKTDPSAVAKLDRDAQQSRVDSDHASAEAAKAKQALDDAVAELDKATKKKAKAEATSKLAQENANLAGKAATDAETKASNAATNLAKVKTPAQKDKDATEAARRKLEEAKAALQDATAHCDYKKAQAELLYAGIEARIRKQQVDLKKSIPTSDASG